MQNPLKNIFIEEMNKKAKQIGMDHSYFVECTGFPSTIEQVMTTRDMLKMVIHASGYKELARIWNKKSYTMNIDGNNAKRTYDKYNSYVTDYRR